MNSIAIGIGLGVIGAVAGTICGAWARQSMATAFGKDPPAAFIEDTIVIVCAILMVWAV